MILLNGLQARDATKIKIAETIKNLKKKSIIPCLAILRIGEHPASITYIHNKKTMANAIGIKTEESVFPTNTPSQRIEQELITWNQNPLIHGILLQLPLPTHLDTEYLISLISPEKDVDGLTPMNIGLILSGNSKGFIPCTPLGCLLLLEHFGFSVQGAHAVIVGRSYLVGRPLASLLLQKHATVTIAHSQTKNLESITVMADFLFVATGSPHLIKKSHIKPGSCVVDIGINRVNQSLTGDVDFEDAKTVAGALSPVPGGVGPMTVIALMQNIVKATLQIMQNISE